MTSPGPDSFTARLQTAGHAVGTGRPQLAVTLANSDLSDSEVQAVGGFAQALSLVTANRLARDAGVKTDFTNDELGQLNAAKEPVEQQPDSGSADSRSFLEQAVDDFGAVWSNTGNFLLHNWITDALGVAGRAIGNAIHYPFRLFSSALDPSNNAEVDREMRADGYDPDSTASYLAFMWSQGENLYHNLDDVRSQYGDDMVDAVIQYQRDPEQFAKDFHAMSPDDAAQVQALMNSPEWDKANAQVDAQHISPGRDLAGLLLPRSMERDSNPLFHVLSGTLDAAYDWFADPTLILGKVGRAVTALDATGRTTATVLQGGERVTQEYGAGRKALQGIANRVDWIGNRRAGLDSTVDQAGIERLLRVDPATGKPVTAVGKGWQRYLDDAKDLRTADASAKAAQSPELRQQAQAEFAGIYRAMQNRYGPLMGMLHEVNGARVIPEGASTGGKVDNILSNELTGGHVTLPTGAKPITDLKDLSNYLVSTDGLLRLHGGQAARRAMVMPGRLSAWAERMYATSAKDSRTAKRTTKKALWFDYRDAQRYLPDEHEIPILDAQAAALGDAEHAVLARSAIATFLRGQGGQAIKTSRAKFDRLSRRLTTQIPNVTRIDLNDPSAARTVEQLARFWINKGDAARLAGAFHVNDLAGRRQVVKGLLEQVFHASGLSRSADGREFMQKYLGDLDEFERQQYGFGKTSLINIDGTLKQAALYPDQLATSVLIPSMRQMSNLAAKFAVGGFGRRTGLASLQSIGTGSNADALMQGIKVGWITSVAGGLRNALDEVANFATYGMGRDALRGRAIFTRATEDLRAKRVDASREYAERLKEAKALGGSRATVDHQINREIGDALVSHTEATRAYDKAVKAGEGVDEAQETLRLATEQLKQARLLESAIRYKLPLGLRRVADNVNDLMIGVVLGKAMTGGLFGKAYKFDEQDVKIAQELVDGELTNVLREGVFQSHFHDSALLKSGDRYAMELARAGLRARPYAYHRIYEGWGEVPADGAAGVDAWAKTLQLRFAHDASPAHVWLGTINAHAGDGPITQEALEAARAAVREHVDTEDFRHYLERMEVFSRVKAGARVGDDQALKNLAKDEYADRVSSDLLQALGYEVRDPSLGMGPSSILINGRLKELLVNGEVPDASWLHLNVPLADRPKTAIGQLYAPYNGKHVPGGFPTGYTQMMTKAYDKVVTDQINALSRNPLVTALYLNARKNTLPYRDKLLAAGWDEGSADEVVRRISLAHAQDEAFRHIDNPYVSSQFSLLSRNWFAFVRAQEDWLRRWGRTIRDNPQVIRQAQLLIHGGQSTGFVEADDQGNATFVYPGSNLMLGLFGKTFGIFGKGNPAQVPVSGELSSRLMFLNPSLDNPVGLSATPLLSLPMKALTSLLGGDHKLLQSGLDQAINGQMGAGRQWYETMLPSWANRILSGVLSNDPGSKYGAAAAQAIANMEAAGQLDDPKLQTASGKARLLTNLSTAIHNNLLFTALFGFVAPAAPLYTPQGAGAAPGDAGKPGTGNRPDFADHAIGLHSLRDEARKAVSDLGYEKALAWWQAVHPGELIYLVGGARTQANSPGATAPATIRAQTWLEAHPDFMARYGGKGGVGAFFMPQGAPGTKDGEFSDVAYRAQLELGIRQYKSLDDLFDEVVTARGASEYYTAKDQYDADRSAAVASGSSQRVKQIDNAWQDVRSEILDRNPLLAERFAQSAVQNAANGRNITDLRAMLDDHSTETARALGANREGLQALLGAYDAYQFGIAQLGDSRSKIAQRKRQELQDAYESQVRAIGGDSLTTGQFPELADLARTVFRLP